MYFFVLTYIYFLQVLRESLCLTIDYLTKEEKVMMANSRTEVAKVESSRLRKDLIELMDQANEAKAKMKEVFEQLRIEKILKIQKDEEI